MDRMMASVLVTIVLAGAASGHRSTAVVIEMIRDEKGLTYFAPREVVARQGDTLRFVERAGTHNVDFLADSNVGATGLPAATTMVDKPGEMLEIVVRLPPGHYYFQCDPHVARGMIGHLTVLPATPPAERY